jgi:prepilin-type N-terminal cleavage/methylation domain-containing protein
MRNLRRGFTLLELMIAISLMLIIMLMLASMFTNAQMMYLRSAKRVAVYTQARASLDAIEQDLMRLETGQENYHTINMRSLTVDDLRRVDGDANSRAYSRLDDWTEPQDAQTLNIREFLSFTGRNTWYSKEEKKYVTGRALVAYYLRRRLPAKDGTQYSGGYLVRRVLPQRSSGELVAIGLGKLKASPLYPSEDELASFVYGVRMFVDDQAAFQLGVRSSNFAYNIMPECDRDDPNAGWTWVKSNGIPTPKPTGKPSAATALQIPARGDRAEFGGDWSTQTNKDRDFTSARWNYPQVVMVDLMMIDSTFERYNQNQGSGTYRSFSRAVQLPVAGPMFRLDDRDLALLLK